VNTVNNRESEAEGFFVGGTQLAGRNRQSCWAVEYYDGCISM